MTIQKGPWGYDRRSQKQDLTYSRDQLINYLGNAVVRNMSYLLNVSPDRHGVIPQQQQDRLREIGAWLEKAGDAIYGTRGGPWQPVDSQYGYTYKDATVFVHLFAGYPGDTFQVPPMGKLKATKVYEVYTGKSSTYTSHEGGIEVTGIDRKSSPPDTIIAVVYDQPIINVWKE